MIRAGSIAQAVLGGEECSHEVVAAEAWIDGIRAKVTARLSPALGTVALDGGEWATGFGERLEDVDWDALVNELFPKTS